MGDGDVAERASEVKRGRGSEYEMVVQKIGIPDEVIREDYSR